MLTINKGLNVDLATFKPFPYDYRSFILYASLFCILAHFPTFSLVNNLLDLYHIKFTCFYSKIKILPFYIVTSISPEISLSTILL